MIKDPKGLPPDR